MVDKPERKRPTERLDLQHKIEDTLSGKRPIDERRYPYFPPDYEIPFVHIGTERQLFLDNFVLDHLEDVERVFPEPYRPEKVIRLHYFTLFTVIIDLPAGIIRVREHQEPVSRHVNGYNHFPVRVLADFNL